MGRALDQNVAWISDNMDHIILPGYPKYTSENGLWWQGVRWVVSSILDVDSSQTVAFIVHRLKGERGLPDVLFLGPNLFRSSESKSSTQFRRRHRRPNAFLCRLHLLLVLLIQLWN